MQNGDDDSWEETGQVVQNERVVIGLDTGSARFLHLNVNGGKLPLVP